MISVLGQLDDSAAFDEVTWRERMRKKPYWRNLHDWARENLKVEDFEPLYSDIGRPSICPVHTFLAMLIQLEKGYSDREMEEVSECDERVKFAQSEGMPDDIKSAGELLERISTQDVEICKETGRVELKQGVAKDRVISVADPEMRHGRKTSSLKSDGYKAHIATVGDNAQIIADVVVTPANTADSEPVSEMVDRIEEATGSKPEETMGDSAYSGQELENKLAKKQVRVVAKIPAPVNKKGLFTKDDFEIKQNRGFVVCPARQYAYFDVDRLLKENKMVTAHIKPDVCNNCELKSRCTESGKGRTIRVRPYEAKRRAKRRH